MKPQSNPDDAIELASELVESYQHRHITRRQFGRRLLGLGFGVSAVSVIIAACGSDDDSGAAGSSSGTSPAAGDTMAPTVGGRLREGYNRDVSKHDPITTNWYDPAFSAIYETIVTDGLEGDTVPQFASGFTVSDDGLTYTFDIPEGRVSHSGGAMGAVQVAEVLQTVKDVSFIGGVSTVPMEGYSVEGNQVVLTKTG
jgi:ABC-type transport system substrate-binding protein